MSMIIVLLIDEEKTCECGDLPAPDCMCDELKEDINIDDYWNGEGLLKAFGGSL